MTNGFFQYFFFRIINYTIPPNFCKNNICLKCYINLFINFNNLYLLHIRKNQIWSEIVILPMVALIFSPTVHKELNILWVSFWCTGCSLSYGIKYRIFLIEKFEKLKMVKFQNYTFIKIKKYENMKDKIYVWKSLLQKDL